MVVGPTSLLGMRPAHGARWRLLAWVAWDCGSASFNVVITSVVFTVYLTGSVAADETSGSTALGIATAAAGVIIAITAPLWGQRGDSCAVGNGRQRRLGAMTAVVVLTTAALAVVRPQPSYLLVGLALLVVGNVAMQLGEVDYNALLRRVAPPGAAGRTSGLGNAALNVGGIAVLLLSYTGFVAPDVGWFGVTRADGMGVRAVAVLCAVWFAVFAVPVVLTRLTQPPTITARARQGWATSYQQLWCHLVSLRQHSPHLLVFLLANALLRDGVAAMLVFLPVVAHGTFGLSPSDVIVFEVAANVIAAAGSVAGGMLDDRVGPKAVIVGSLVGLVATVTTLAFLNGRWEFWLCGSVLAAFIGPSFSAPRSYLARAAPPGQEGELFGLSAATGRFVSFLAPATFAAGALILGGQRYGMLGIAVVLLAGLLTMLPVRAVNGETAMDFRAVRD